MSFISLSASKLGVLRECKTCFFDANALKIERPRGIFPSLPGGIDRVMKDWGDQYRGAMFPGVAITGKLWGTVAEIGKLRHWKSGLKAELHIGDTTVGLIGALDDLIVHENGTYSPYDTKTKGDVPKDDGSQYYLTQMDLYTLFLRENGMTPSGHAYLNYFYPIACDEGGVRFDSKLYELQTDADRAVDLVKTAVGILQGPRPSSNPQCEYCQYSKKRFDVILKGVRADLTALEADESAVGAQK